MVANMQPPRLPVSEPDRRRRHQTKMELGWNNARPDARPEGEKTKPNTSHSGQGLEIKEKFLHFRSRAKNVLDIPSYTSGDYTRVDGVSDSNEAPTLFDVVVECSNRRPGEDQNRFRKLPVGALVTFVI
jgi:hypothetical protein